MTSLLSQWRLRVAAPTGPNETRGSLTHREPIRAGFRQATVGLLAAAVTYGVGMLLGTAVH